MSSPKFSIPTIFVIFGATGDLAQKKIIPALYNLYRTGQLPKQFKIIGVARRPVSPDEFRKYVTEVLEKFCGQPPADHTLAAFLNTCSYHQAQFGNTADYAKIAAELGVTDIGWSVCSNKLFYLAVPPEQYEMLLQHLSESGLTNPCSPEEGWTRILIEKPFGKDSNTATKIEDMLGKLFREEQVYRIDHYLAKEMTQNILTFRFANTLLEESWNNKFIESIKIRNLESSGVEQRGSFYDGLGALRDVGQNHLLQMLALVTMNRPASFSGDSIRQRRQEILETLRIPDEAFVKHHTFRAQYQGYRKITGVRTDSTTETYFKVKAFLDTPRWQGVPITLESGKRLGVNKTYVTVYFKETFPRLPGLRIDEKLQNKVFFCIDPKEEIHISFMAKKPGLTMEVEERDFEFTYRDVKSPDKRAEDYERILMDCIRGDQILFVTTGEVNAMWRYIDPIVCAWEAGAVPLNTYVPDNEDIRVKSRIIDDTPAVSAMPQEVGVIGLGKMGKGIALQLIEKGWRVHGYNRTFSVTQELEKDGLYATQSLRQLVDALPKPRVLWIMVPAGKPVDEVLFGPDGVSQYLEEGDIVIDAGNSLYKDAPVRAAKLKERGIRFMDVGTSGGPAGARYGACLMIGGERDTFQYLQPLFTAVALPGGYEFFEGYGAGHFVKMVHNGIEYGMMQALAEGFALMKQSDYNLDLEKVAALYNRGSVIESRLVGWLREGFQTYGPELKGIGTTINHSGEGQWTVDTARELAIPVPIIEKSLDFRKESKSKPAFTNKVVNVLRNMFGGHTVK
ncbi:MAG: glucose-6-phosphate dehydrogenase [Patescibacteria group bacterium]|nr:glucose-6-phosphate dehydrogenase [Patescibacteria group bacterium]